MTPWEYNHTYRAADTTGAMLGLVIAVIVVLVAQSAEIKLEANTFHTIVRISLVPVFLAAILLMVWRPSGKKE